MKIRFLYLFLFSSLLFLLPGCVKDKIKDINATYTGTLAFPVAQVGFTVEEALDGDSLYVVDDDNAVRLIYRDENFYTLSAADYLDDITGNFLDEQTEVFQIDPVGVDDIVAEADIAFADIVDDFDDPALKMFFEQNNGASLPVPAFLEDIQDDVNTPTFSNFTGMEIESGILRVSVTNNLFFEVVNLSATVIDEGNSQVVGTVTFDQIPVGETATDEIDLAGLSLSNDFRMELGNLETPGTGGVPVTIDLEAYLSTLMEIRDVVIKAGQVILPGGTYLTDEFIFEMEFDEDERIYEMELENGTVDYTFSSEVEAGFFLKLTFPDITRDGSPVTHGFTVANTSGGSSSGTLDFSNTIWHLDQNAGQAYNRMRVEYVVSLPGGSGTQVNFSDEDEVSFQLLIAGLEPVFVEGYLGKKSETIPPGEIDLGLGFNVFDESSSPIFFDDPVIRVEVENSFGVPINIEFLAGAIGHSGATAALNAPNPLVINRPGIVGQSVGTNLVFDKNNSGIVDMMAIYPVAINYEGAVTANPADDVQIVNFVTNESRLTASAEMDLPFKFSAENLVYRESGDAVNLDLKDGLTIDDIDSAVLKIVYHNDLPLKSTFRLSTIGAGGTESTLIDDVVLEAGTANPAGRVDEAGTATGEIFIRLGRAQILQLDEAIENVYMVSFMTPENAGPLGIYSDYGVNINIGMAITFNR